MIKNGKVVDLSYVLKDDSGEVLDQAEEDEPFSYLHGAQQIVPGLEKALNGLKVGDKKLVVVPPAQGYGEMDPNLRMTLSRAQFPKGAEIEVGMVFEASSGGDQEMVFSVEEIKGDQVMVDGNHPLAGETLHFDVKIIGVREATAEELEHGHAHGAHGHGHDHDHDDDGHGGEGHGGGHGHLH
jgi:FKBP-type peptidyl-prolyl cis-trans isomerase SlyD